MTIEIDDLDRRLIDELKRDGRATNKAIAQALGIAESTVATRLRQLRDDKVMLVALRRDLHSKGFDLQCFVDVYVKGRAVETVARRKLSSSLHLGSPANSIPAHYLPASPASARRARSPLARRRGGGESAG